MTLQEKAKELVAKYQNIDIEIGGQYDGYLTMNLQDAKQCALIAVDEILDVDCCDMSEEYFDNHIEYWKQVKTEIQNL
jgi:hypothetical protein